MSPGRRVAPRPGTPSRRRRLLALLGPGMGLKRWSAALVLGLASIALGAAFALSAPVGSNVIPLLRTLTLDSLPAVARGGVFLVLGLLIAAVAGRRVYGLLVLGARRSRGGSGVLASLYEQRGLEHGPRIVAIGGGTGLSTLLRGLKGVSDHVTAIVTVADDGGSSGELRRELGIPPPGDARNCIVALSRAEPVLEALFDYRFRKTGGGNGHGGLDGHSVGNLVLAALSDLRGGFGGGLEAAGELLALSGRVVPVTEEVDVVLVGETESGAMLVGESAVGHASEPLVRVRMEPEAAVVSAGAVEALALADLVVIGPGSLYTSIIPNFLVRGMPEAVTASPARKVFVCNVATQPGETEGYGMEEHLRVFREHAGVEVTHVLCNDNVEPLPEEWKQVAVDPAPGEWEQVTVDPAPGGRERPGRVVAADLVDERQRTRHDPVKLANALLALARRP